MSSTAFKRFMFRTKYRFHRRHVPTYHRQAVEREHLSPAELDAFNWSRRKAILDFAYENTTFYREKYSRIGLEPQDIRTPEDWARVPALTREEVATRRDDMLTLPPDSRHLKKMTTGGSTGAPLTTFRDLRLPTEALAWRMLGWWGLDPSCDGAYVWRMRVKPGIRLTLNELMWWPTAKLRYDSSSMTEEGIEGFCRGFNRLAPPLLQGYTGAIEHVARYVKDQDLRVHSPEAIWVTSSPLSEKQRELIEAAFDAPVYDQYGSCERAHISAQCRERGGLHIHHDSVCVEIVDHEARPVPTGTHGKILLTDLDNRVFPLIRYDSGDEGRLLPDPCPCGLTLPMMDKVAGRVSDNLTLPDGTVLAGAYLTTIFDDTPDAVLQFQVRQAADRSISVHFVENAARSESGSEIAMVEARLRERIGGQVPLTMVSRDEIEHDRGKLRFVINEAD